AQPLSGRKRGPIRLPESNPVIIGITCQRGDHMVRQLTLSQACEGFIHYKRATGKSPHTILDYQATLKKLRGFFKDNPPPAFLTRDKLVAFFSWLQDGYLSEPIHHWFKRAKPGGKRRDAIPLQGAQAQLAVTGRPRTPLPGNWEDTSSRRVLIDAVYEPHLAQYPLCL
ncbi:MAG: hypothetical protein NTU91_08090, partial [Chloroflexi bacterium]|nr:hypothetical protein [Chloroflexota bacterium]